MNGIPEVKGPVSPTIVIPDSFQGYPKESFAISSRFDPCVKNVLIPGGLISDRIERMALDIVSQFDREGFTALCVLKGGYQFFSDLIAQLRKIYRYDSKSTPVDFTIKTEFIRIASYLDDSSTGKVTITGIDQMHNLRGTNVLIVEDIIDSGQTMVKLLDTLKDFGPRCIRVASLFLKRNPESSGYIPDYVGFEVPNKFIIGYNLDYNDHFRELNHVCVISDEGKEQFSHVNRKISTQSVGFR